MSRAEPSPGRCRPVAPAPARRRRRPRATTPPATPIRSAPTPRGPVGCARAPPAACRRLGSPSRRRGWTVMTCTGRRCGRSRPPLTASVAPAPAVTIRPGGSVGPAAPGPGPRPGWPGRTPRRAMTAPGGSPCPGWFPAGAARTGPARSAVPTMRSAGSPPTPTAPGWSRPAPTTVPAGRRRSVTATAAGRSAMRRTGSGGACRQL